MIRDINETGARLSFPTPVALPDLIELHVPQRKEHYRATVRWKRGREVGVQIGGPEVAAVDSPSIAPAVGLSVEDRLRRDAPVNTEGRLQIQPARSLP